MAYIWLFSVTVLKKVKVKLCVYITPFPDEYAQRGHPNIQPSTRPVNEPGISGLGGGDLTAAPTPPILESFIESDGSEDNSAVT